MVNFVRGCAVLAAVALSLPIGAYPTLAHAEPAARLVYQRGTGAESCPDEAELRRAVVARLGEDPFDPAAAPAFYVTLTGDGATLSGRVVSIDGTGATKGVRELTSDRGCAELVEGLALAISLAQNPALLLAAPAPSPSVPAEPAPPAVTGPTPVAAAPADEEPEPSETPLPAPGWTYAAGVTGYFAGGSAPKPTPGLGPLLRVRRGPLSVAAEGRFDAPGSRDVASGGTVTTRLIAGELVPCYHFLSIQVQACAVGLVGSLHAEAPDLPAARTDTGVYAAAGVRGAVEIAELRYFRLQLRADLLARLFPVSVSRNDGQTTLWEAPLFSGAFGLGALVEIP